MRQRQEIQTVSWRAGRWAIARQAIGGSCVGYTYKAAKMSEPEPENFQEWNPPITRHRSALPGGGADLARRLMDDMDPEVLEFLKTAVNTFIKWDLVIFFYENPNTNDTADNIARYIGRDAGVIVSELDELASVGVVQRQITGQLLVYSLSTDPQVRERIKHFVSASDDRQFRVKAIYHLIRGMR
jgi:hypothetical protein